MLPDSSILHSLSSLETILVSSCQRKEVSEYSLHSISLKEEMNGRGLVHWFLFSGHLVNSDSFIASHKVSNSLARKILVAQINGNL